MNNNPFADYSPLYSQKYQIPSPSFSKQPSMINIDNLPQISTLRRDSSIPCFGLNPTITTPLKTPGKSTLRSPRQLYSLRQTPRRTNDQWF